MYICLCVCLNERDFKMSKFLITLIIITYTKLRSKTKICLQNTEQINSFAPHITFSFSRCLMLNTNLRLLQHAVEASDLTP